jgi:hypothetical protein
MRLVSTILLCLLLVGGTWIYLNIDSQIKIEAAEVHYKKASGKAIVSITRTFECFGDEQFHEPAIHATFGSEVVYSNESTLIPASEPVEFELEGVEELENSINVTANATDPNSFGDDAPPLRAMVVKVTYNDKPVAEEIFYGDANAIAISGDVAFKIPREDDGHDHQ